MLRTTLSVLAALACLLPGSLFAQPSLGWNYVGNSGQGSLTSGQIAGATGFAQANWNNHAGIGQGPGTVPLNNLTDQFGVATTIDVTGWTQTSNNSWRHTTSALVDPNARLTNDFADQRPAITFANLSSEFTTNGSSVVLYYGNNEGPSTSVATVDGIVDDLISKTITTGNSTVWYGNNSTWLEEVAGGSNVPSNYTVFSGLNDAGFTVSLANQNNNGISAIQIVANAAAVPEPASVALWLTLGGIALVVSRRWTGRARR
jgi:hypothetical protein